MTASPLVVRTTVQLGSVNYLVRNRVEYEFPAGIELLNSPLRPAVVITLESWPTSLKAIEDTLARFDAEDDVFSPHFVSDGYLLVQSSSEKDTEAELPGDLVGFLDARRTKLLRLTTLLPQGPYFVQGSGLHQAWRLYEDSYEAFTAAIIPNDEKKSADDDGTIPTYTPFDTAVFSRSASYVPVPSRLYFTRSPELPLAGLRLTIKDNFHISGTVTTLGNRSYAELNGMQRTTAKYVEVLTSRGAIVLGKAKLNAFAGAKYAPGHYIDFSRPYNPRGDGYQDSSGSSSGSAVSVAGYPWVDASVGTDSSGSTRFPASCMGVWGHRVSWGAVSVDGLVPHTQPWDNIGLFTREPKCMLDLLAASGLGIKHQMPTHILYPTDWFPHSDASQQKLVENFLSVLEAYLGIKHTKISLLEEWHRTGPEHLRETSLIDYMGTSADSVSSYTRYNNSSSFVSEYAALFGKKPAVSIAQTTAWNKYSVVTSEQAKQGQAILDVFKNWIATEIFKIDDKSASVVMLIPQGRPGANYRDDTGSPTVSVKDKNTGSYIPLLVPSILGYPQVIVPIGNNTYTSKFTGLTEYAPIVTTILGPHGSDSMLVKLAASALESAGLPSSVLAGRSMYADK